VALYVDQVSATSEKAIGNWVQIYCLPTARKGKEKIKKGKGEGLLMIDQKKISRRPASRVTLRGGTTNPNERGVYQELAKKGIMRRICSCSPCCFGGYGDSYPERKKVNRGGKKVTSLVYGKTTT